MFRIGDFSRIARVSCRLLRYYDELGLLRPAIVDRASGYRFYSAAQLPRLNRILVLKELGLSLDQIGPIIDENVSAAQLRAMLLLRRADIERELAAQSARLRQVEARISQIEVDGELTHDDVLVRSEPPKRILAARATTRSFLEARRMIARLVEQAPRHVPKKLLGSFIAIAHSPEFEPDAIDVELGYVLMGDGDCGAVIVDGLELRVRDLPGVEHMAVCVRVGLPEQAHLVTGRIGRFVEKQGYRLAGPNREVFLQPPQPQRMEHSVVEMQYPVQPLAAADGPRELGR